jgi:hypothetical protein
MNKETFYTDLINIIEAIPKEKLKRKNQYLGFMRYQLKLIEGMKERNSLQPEQNLVIHGKTILLFD